MTIKDLPVWTFEPNWDSEVTETLSWLTNILTSPIGAEQRRALRNRPRRALEYKITIADNHRSFLSNFVTVHGGRDVYAPMWHDQYETEAVSSGKNVFYSIGNNLATVMLNSGDICMIIGSNPLEFEVFEVDNFELDRIRSVQTLSRNWPIGSRVYKLVESRFDAEQPALDIMSAEVSNLQVRFHVMEENIIAQPPPMTGGPTLPPSRGFGQAALGAPMIQPQSNLVSATYQDTDDSVGTAKDQFIMAAAAFAAYEALSTETDDDLLEASDYYKDLALQLMDGIGDGEDITPILRAPIPDDSATINLPHWLFMARGAAVEDAVRLTATFTVEADGQSIIIPPGSFRGDLVEHIYSIYPATGELFIDDPFSPAYDYENPTVTIQWAIDDWSTTDDTGTLFYLPDAADDLGILDWKVVYRYPSQQKIELGQAYHVVPEIHVVDDELTHYTPDTLKFAERALSRAILYDDRAGMAAQWSNLQASWRHSDLKGRKAVYDQRWIFEPMPLADAIPLLSDWPTGFACISTNTSASPPGVPDSDADWTGFDFWSRDTNGDWLADVPVDDTIESTQIWRNFSDQWRQAATGQDADQYLYVQLACTHKPTSGEYFLVFVSSSQDGATDETWWADIGSLSGFVATTIASGTVIDFKIPRTSFKLRTFDDDGNTVWGSTMPAGQILKCFGIAAEIDDAYGIRLRSMRLLAGSSSGWVDSNLAKAKKGYALPFIPGAVPAFISANLVKQEYLGNNGSPLHGYQLADVWHIVATEAIAEFPGLTAADLPVPNYATNAIEYPISATTSVGAVAKTAPALLVEQQLRFLLAAQQKWADDGGDLGPYAHTYTLNTYDRFSFVDQTINKWVYENFPYSGWGGFQYRIIESLAQFIDMSTGEGVYSDARPIAITLLTNFIDWLGTAWPNLDGHIGSVDGLVIHSGDENSYHQFTGEVYPVIEGYIE